ncbi:MAG: efflux RND transporter periplasmic adaptor subunit [Gemmatimonas sp.]
MNAPLRQSAPLSLMATLVAMPSLLVMLAACGDKKEAAAETTAANPVQTIGPDNIAIARTDTLRSGPPISGTLVADREARIRAEVSGAVLQTFVDQGQAVRAGQTLARIDAGPLNDAALSARSGVTQARVTAEQAERELQRARTLVAAGAIAARDVEAAERGSLVAQAALADAQSRAASANRGLRNTVIRAPFAGVVSEKSVNPGDIVAPGAALFTVIDPRSLRLEASVPTSALGDVRVGAPISFTVNGFADRALEGRITRVNPVVDPTTKQVRLIASVPNEGGRLVSGLFVEGRVDSQRRVGVLVPEQAVDQTAVVPYVMRLKSGKVDRVEIGLGVRDQAAEAFEVTSGIVAGDTVLLGAARGISAGTSVVVSAPRDGSAQGASAVAPPPARGSTSDTSKKN